MMCMHLVKLVGARKEGTEVAMMEGAGSADRRAPHLLRARHGCVRRQLVSTQAEQVVHVIHRCLHREWRQDGGR